MDKIAIGDKITYGRTHGKKYTAIVVKVNKVNYKVIRKEDEYLIHEYVKPSTIIEIHRPEQEQEVKPSLVSRLQRENNDLKEENRSLHAQILKLKGI